METSLMQEGISKDLQIKILEEKLAFVQRQLEEKDKQLEHYKGLVKTMQELLDAKSGSQLARPSPPGLKEPVSPKHPPGYPPGFENKFSLKGRRPYHSFHVDPAQARFDEDALTNNREEYEDPDDDYEEYEREMARRQAEYEAELYPSSNNNASPKASSTSSLKKSKSHTSLSQISDERGFNPLRSSTSSLPNFNNVAPKKSPSSGNPVPSSKEAARLKKSQSMSSVYSALEENRLDLKFPDLDQMSGQIYQLSKYQQGCRFLQKKIEEDPKNTEIILKELVEHLIELMTDPFGNYLFTKLVEHCDNAQRETLLQRILPEISTAAFDMYGTQSLQKIMPLLSDQQTDQFVAALKTHSLALIKHNKANYLIQYCLDKLTDKHNQWIFDAVRINIEEVARDRVGCVIVKRCIDHANQSHNPSAEALLNRITNATLSLVQDPFGNYVVQHVLQKFPYHEHSRNMIRKMVGSVTELCTQKFSSNVVEKCLKVADDETRTMLLAEIIDSEHLPQLLNDRFANFVIQTALDVANADQRQKLVKNILPHLGKHYSPYTKRLQKKILQV